MSDYFILQNKIGNNIYFLQAHSGTLPTVAQMGYEHTNYSKIGQRAKCTNAYHYNW